MAEKGFRLPTRNLLTGAVVNWVEDDAISEVTGNLVLSWKDLSVYRKKKLQTSIWRSPVYEDIKVLHEVSGLVSSGNLVAIMGSSGAGKTSLLAAISRRDKGEMTGYIMLNSRLIGASIISKISGFVAQHDLAVEDLTVHEHMEFMARLMMDRRCSSGSRTRRVQQLLTDLAVATCSETKLKDLSGGERKRVSLAVQLLNDPPILFCDEPTTGLDSWAAHAVVTRLRALAIAGKLVVCSVHQPNSGVFELFHQVILISNGRIAFHGTIEQAEDFFTSLNYKCPIGFNAAEYYVSLLGIEVDRELESRDRIRKICNEYGRSSIARTIEKKIKILDETDFDSDGFNYNDRNEVFEKYLTLVKVNCFVQFYWLMWRNIQTMKHNSSIWIAEFLLLMFVGVVCSVPYINTFEDLDQCDIQNVEGLLYLTITEDIFLFIYAVFITFPSELPILLRETAHGLYSPGPYYLSKMIFWIPRAVIEPVLFASLIYYVVGFQDGIMGWLGFCFVCVLCANYANAYGSFLSSVFDKMETAALVSVPFDLLGTMFSGLYINLASLSPWISWIRYLSGFYYGVESISILQWSNINNIGCDNLDGLTCIRNGSQVLTKFGFSESNFWRNCGCLVVMYFVAHFIAYINVVKRSRGTPIY